MAIQTRTFPVTLTATATTAITELAHFRDITLGVDDCVGIYLESFGCNISLKSFQMMVFPDYEGDESESEKIVKFNAAESRSQKIGLRILTRKNNTGSWREKAEIVLTYAGRKSYMDLLRPYLAQNSVRLFEFNDAIGIQLIDYGNGLLKQNDFIEIELAFSVNFEKKNNDIEALKARIEILELALEGKLTNLPANTLLGRNLTNGTVEPIPQLQFVGTQGDQTINGLKTFVSSIASSGAFIVSNINGRVILDHNGSNAARFQAWGNSITSYGQFVFNQYFSNGSGARNAMICNPDSTWNIGNSLNTDANLNTIFGSTRITGFTTFGDNIGVKIKRVTGTLPASQGGTVNIPLNIDSAKVVGCIAIVRFDSNCQIPPNFTLVSGYEYEFHTDENLGIFRLSASNSSMLTSKPCEALIFYTA